MSGTPTWVVGGKYVLYGARDYDGLSAAVAQARKGK
jgi:protein-disulfide isomerase